MNYTTNRIGGGGHVPVPPPSYALQVFFLSYSFETELIYHQYTFFFLSSKLILDENNDLHNFVQGCQLHVSRQN